MSINSNYSTSTVNQFASNDATTTNRTNLKSAFDALGTALQSGDLSGAQQAFAQIQNAHKAHGHRRHTGGADADGDHDSTKSGNAANSGISVDFKALSDALSSRNLAAAQQAWTKLQNDQKNFGFSAKPAEQPSAPTVYAASDPGLNVSA